MTEAKLNLESSLLFFEIFWFTCPKKMKCIHGKWFRYAYQDHKLSCLDMAHSLSSSITTHIIKKKTRQCFPRSKYMHWYAAGKLRKKSRKPVLNRAPRIFCNSHCPLFILPLCMRREERGRCKKYQAWPEGLNPPAGLNWHFFYRAFTLPDFF